MATKSGKFVLRVPPALHERLSLEATARDVSLNEYCNEILKRSSGAVSEDIGVYTAESINIREPLVASILKEFPEIVGVVFFGSASRGEETEISDIDLLLVLPLKTALSRELYSRWRKLENDPSVPHNVSPHFVLLPQKAEEAGSIWFEAAIDGSVLYDRDLTLRPFIRQLRLMFATGKIRREAVHGHPCWIREENA